MAVSVYTFVDNFRRCLDNAAGLLRKGAAFAAERGVSEAEMLDWRLIEDMKPLGFQIMVVINFAQQWPARAAGVAVPEAVAEDLSVAGFLAEIAKAKAFLATLTPEQLTEREDAPVSYEIMPGMAPTLPASQWLAVFATTNLYFHQSTAYGILRSKGLPLGKPDLFAAGL